ncbi:MAG TPA: endonuclease/exonuclease/phosphatase family protein [Hyphomicrobiaceae bacterium]|nr:endonuclease/exonuclease/phosphatase family protein [Hyphomicrobiaceae bacterium]
MPGSSSRLVSYNLLEGLRPIGQGPGERRELDRERTEAARSVVQELSPEVLVLNESLFCQQYRGHVVDYGRLFGFPYQAAALYDNAWGNAVLSRHPILRSHEMKTVGRGGVVALIDAPIGTFTVASYHPHPSRNPSDKAADFERLVAGLEGPVIVCGDLNCISPADDVDRDALIAAFRRFARDPEATLAQFIESGRQVFGALAKFGFEDAIPRTGRRYSIPTDLISLDKSSGMRIDHILANSAVVVGGGEVVHSPLTNRASDHHPVVLDFHLRSGLSVSPGTIA